MDIDIDTNDTFNKQMVFPSWIQASRVHKARLIPHPCGIYPSTIPYDPLTGLAAIPFKQADSMGYMKIDFLHLRLYDLFSSRAEMTNLMREEIDWGLLLSPVICSQLFQNLGKYFKIIFKTKPSCIIELADILALIRPGKRHLLNEYYKCSCKSHIRQQLYQPTTKGYYLKKSHAIAYAQVIGLQLRMIKSGIAF